MEKKKRSIRFDKLVFGSAIVGSIVTRPLFGMPPTLEHWAVWIVVMLVVASVGAVLVGTFMRR